MLVVEPVRYSRQQRWPGASAKILKRYTTVGAWHCQAGGPAHTAVFVHLRRSLCSGLYGFIDSDRTPLVRPSWLRHIAHNPEAGTYWSCSAAEVPYVG